MRIARTYDVSHLSTRARANDAIERYTDTGWLRAIVGSIPIAGTALDAVITSADSQITQRRISALAEELAALGRRIEEKIDPAFFESVGWQDLAIKTFVAAARTQDRERLKMYAGILLGPATASWPKQLDNEAALSALAELSPTEVQLLRHFRQFPLAEGIPVGSMGQAREAWDNAVENLHANLRDDLTFHLKRIERAGFISELTGAYLDYGGGVYTATSTFVRLMDSLDRLT